MSHHALWLNLLNNITINILYFNCKGLYRQMIKRKKTLKTLALFLVGMVLVWLIIGIVIGLVAPDLLTSDLTLGSFAATIVLQDVLLFSLLVVCITYYSKTWKRRSFLSQRWQRKWWRLFRQYSVGARVFYLVGMVIVGAILQATGLQIPWFNGEQGLVSTFEWFNIVVWWQYVVMFLLVSVATPFIEEAIYRTFIADILAKHWTAVAIVGSSLLFALSHLEMWVVVNLFVLWLLLAYIYHKTGSWWYPFFFHMIINTMSLVILFLSPMLPV